MLKQFILGMLLLFSLAVSANNPSQDNLERDLKVVPAVENSVNIYSKEEREELKKFFVRKKRLEYFLESNKKIKKRKYTIA